jgi:hypothetical protein
MRALRRMASIRLPPLGGTISIETMRISFRLFQGLLEKLWPWSGLDVGSAEPDTQFIRAGMLHS